MRKIDIFTHIFPAAYFARMSEVAPDYKDAGKRVRGVPMLVDLDERFRVMDRFDGYQQVLSIATPPIEAYARPADAIDLARRANDGMAELVQKHPDRFPGFVASLPLNDPEAARSRNTSCRHRAWRPRHPGVHQRLRKAHRRTASFCRCSTRWRPSIFRSGCIRIVARRSRTMRPKTVRSTRFGGRSDGPTKPAWPCLEWSSPDSSTGIRI